MLKLRAAAMVALLGTSILGAGALLAPAQAAVSPAVGNALNEAHTLVTAKKYREAMDKVNVAAAAAKTAEERNDVDQMKKFVAISSGDASIGGALGAKAKFANDANGGRWKDVIADGEMLRKAGAMDGQSSLVIAQAYYQLHDSKGCINYIKHNGLGGEAALTLLQRCAYDANDDETQRSALEQLVSSTGKPEHWKSLLHLAERARGISDHNTLDLYRLKAMTGTLDGADEVSTYAQIALQLKFPAEAEAVVQKGIADKSMPANDRTNRLLKLATDRANAAAAAQGKTLADAQKQPQGDALIQIGEDEIGQGKAKDAIDIIKAGIAKGDKDPANAQLRLGTAYLAAGEKADAIKAFNAVKGDDKTMMIAHLYSLAAHSSSAASSDESSTPAAKAPARKHGRR